MDNQDESEYGQLSPQAASWSQDRRLKFIDFRLRWEGKVNRSDLTEFFDISAPQASADLARYAEAAVFNLNYDVKQKAYVRAPNYVPLYSRSSSRAYLNDLLGLVTGSVEGDSSLIGWHPEVGVAPTPIRHLDGRALSIVLQAIREHRRVSMAYQGVSRSEPVAREISPHALGFDGMRWHVRAYCHLREKFQDFVLGRILDVELAGPTTLTGGDDVQWNNMLTISIAPHPQLSPAAKKTIRLEYGMVEGALNIECREALLFYAIRRLGLQADREATQTPTEQQIILLNRNELQPYLDKVEKKGKA